MSLKLDLKKRADGLRLGLSKKGINEVPKVDLAFNLDVSGSFDDEHQDGLTQDLLQRLVPWGMVFDPDQKLDIFTFSDGIDNVCYVGEITPENCENYIRDNIINNVPGYNGGTDYSYVLEKNLQHFGWIQQPEPVESAPKKSFFGKLLFGGNNKTAETAMVSTEKRRSLVIFVTDGKNDDEQRTEKILQESQVRHDEVYFLFIGISNQGGNFPFLQKIGDRFSNTGLVIIRDLKDFVSKSDEEINDELIGEELLDWLKSR